MKAQAFLELVGKMMTAQQDYFKAKREGAYNAKQLLIESKEIEKQVRAVVKEGWLEPDFMATLEVTNDEQSVEKLLERIAELERAGLKLPTVICSEFEYKEHLRRINEEEIREQLDLLEDQRPTDGKGETEQ